MENKKKKEAIKETGDLSAVQFAKQQQKQELAASLIKGADDHAKSKYTDTALDRAN